MDSMSKSLKRTMHILSKAKNGLGSKVDEKCMKHSLKSIKGKRTTRTEIIDFDDELGAYPIDMIKGMDGKAFCPVCYKNEKEKQVYNEKTLPSIEKRRVQGISTYLKDKSIVNDKNVLEMNFEGFKVDTVNEKNVKHKAIEIRDEILNGSNDTFLFVGSYGVGKSHLAFSIMDSINKLSYKNGKPMKCIFIQISKMFVLLENGYSLPKEQKETYKYKQKYFMELVENADFIVFDDLGAELGKNEKGLETTNARIRLLSDMFESILNKPKIITTNLTKEQILQTYDGRLESRLLSNINQKPLVFLNINDKRKGEYK